MALSRLIGTAPKMADLSGQTLTGEVLLVDDTPGNRKITVATLRYMGLFPDEVINGEEAMKAVSNKHYDLVLMDVQMPVMSGLEATVRDGKLDGDARHVPIVALTANALPEEPAACMTA